MLSDEALREFKKIYTEELGEDISDEKAMELGTSLLTFFHHTYRPVKKSWLKEFSSNEKNK